MTMRVKPDTGDMGVKREYRVKNWSTYNLVLVNRGNLKNWFDEKSIRNLWTPPPAVGRETPGQYSDMVIQMCLTNKGLFQLPYWDSPRNHNRVRKHCAWATLLQN